MKLGNNFMIKSESKNIPNRITPEIEGKQNFNLTESTTYLSALVGCILFEMKRKYKVF
jgi:hypothetical protein